MSESRTAIDLLEECISNKKLNLIKSLISEFKIDVNAKNGRLLNKAIQHGYTEAVEMLIEQKANVDLSYENVTPIFASIKNSNNAEIFKTLIKAKANVNCQNEKGDTPLIHLAWNVNFIPNCEWSKLLIEAKADLDNQGEDNATALIWAIRRNNLPMAMLLIEAGADLLLCDKNKKYPLNYACEEEQWQIVDNLLSHGDEVNPDPALFALLEKASKCNFILQNCLSDWHKNACAGQADAPADAKLEEHIKKAQTHLSNLSFFAKICKLDLKAEMLKHTTMATDVIGIISEYDDSLDHQDYPLQGLPQVIVDHYRNKMK